MTKISAALIFLVLLGVPFAYGDELTGPRGTQLAPLPTWTGFYVGLNAGGLWSNGNAPATVDWSRLAPGNFPYSTAFASVPQAGFAWTKKPGFVGGGQVGYNWQVTDRIVVGVETDFQGVTGGNTEWLSRSSSH